MHSRQIQPKMLSISFYYHWCLQDTFCDLQGLFSETDNLCRVDRIELQFDVVTPHTWRRVFASHFCGRRLSLINRLFIKMIYSQLSNRSQSGSFSEGHVQVGKSLYCFVVDRFTTLHNENEWKTLVFPKILLKCLVFTPGTSNWAQNVVNVDLTYPRMK